MSTQNSDFHWVNHKMVKPESVAITVTARSQQQILWMLRTWNFFQVWLTMRGDERTTLFLHQRFWQSILMRWNPSKRSALCIFLTSTLSRKRYDLIDFLLLMNSAIYNHKDNPFVVLVNFTTINRKFSFSRYLLQFSFTQESISIVLLCCIRFIVRFVDIEELSNLAFRDQNINFTTESSMFT